MKKALASHGEPAVLIRRARRAKRRPLVILCDVSGSMEAYTRLLLHMSHALARGWGRVETFTFGTRLTRITRQLRERHPDAALAHVSRAVSDWSGGTRIGDALHEFNLRWSRRVLGRGAIVLLVTDGPKRKSLTDRVARTNHSSADLFLSIHHDSVPDSFLEKWEFEGEASGLPRPPPEPPPDGGGKLKG